MKVVDRRDGALRAALVPAFSPHRFRRFVDAGGALEELCRPSSAQLGNRLGIGRSEAQSLARALARADPLREFEAAAAAGIEVHAWGDEAYPAVLAQLCDPPPAFYLRGELLDCDARAVALVGSRRATPYGLRMARLLAGDLARAGVTVVSGLARGIDVAAHLGAMDAGGRTIAVLGSGLLEPYPPEHVDVLERIARQGAALSEFPLRAPPSRFSFPRRNRLVAALALGVLVVEAGERSGALGTVRHALDLGRTVLAVPGRVEDENSRGTLRMLQEGACPVGSAEDVFSALGWCRLPPGGLPPAEQEALESLPEGGATAAELATLLSGGEAESVASLLVTLEVRGLVRRGEGGRYRAL